VGRVVLALEVAVFDGLGEGRDFLRAVLDEALGQDGTNSSTAPWKFVDHPSNLSSVPSPEQITLSLIPWQATVVRPFHHLVRYHRNERFFGWHI
jgi:hypothetical protein